MRRCSWLFHILFSTCRQRVYPQWAHWWGLPQLRGMFPHQPLRNIRILVDISSFHVERFTCCARARAEITRRAILNILSANRSNWKYTVIVSTATKTFADMSHYIALYWLLWTFNVIVTYRHLLFSVIQPSNMPKKFKNDIRTKKDKIVRVGSNCPII